MTRLTPFLLADGSAVKLRWTSTKLLVARDGSIWVTAAEGVFQIKDGVLHNWCRQNGLLESTFAYMCEDDDGADLGRAEHGDRAVQERGTAADHPATGVA